MASVTTKSARSLTAKSPPRAKARVTLTTQATVGERAAGKQPLRTFVSLHAVEPPQFRGRYHDFPRRLIDIPGMDLDALVQETADLAADDIMEEMETQNAGLAPPKRRVGSRRPTSAKDISTGDRLAN